jgi:hypothetical protein
MHRISQRSDIETTQVNFTETGPGFMCTSPDRKIKVKKNMCRVGQKRERDDVRKNHDTHYATVTPIRSHATPLRNHDTQTNTVTTPTTQL